MTTVTLYCGCGEYRRVDIDLGAWGSPQGELIEVEDALCPSCMRARPWLESQCPGCVDVFPGCVLVKDGRELREVEIMLITRGLCPWKIGGTFLSTDGALSSIDKSATLAPSAAGQAMMDLLDAWCPEE